MSRSDGWAVAVGGSARGWLLGGRSTSLVLAIFIDREVSYVTQSFIELLH